MATKIPHMYDIYGIWKRVFESELYIDYLKLFHRKLNVFLFFTYCQHCYR